MSKKSILSTLLISSALLGTISATAATSAVRPEKKLVTIEKKEAKVYKNSKLKTAKKMKKGTVYKVNGYRLINKKHYYRVYQEDKKGKLVYKGYLLDKDTKVIKGQKPAKKDRLVTLTKNDQPAWKNLYFNTKVATYDGKKHTSNFEVKSIYHINDKKYFSLYRGEKWMGYMDASAFKVLTPKNIAEDKQNYKVVKNYDTYNDIYFHKKDVLTKGEKVKVTRTYTFGTGRQYGSIYNEEGEWLGYANMSALEMVEDSKPSEPSVPTKPETKPEQPETKPEIPDENPNASLEELIKGVKEQAKQVYLSTTQQKKLNQFLDTVEKISSSDKEAISDVKSDLRQTKRELTNSPSLEDVNVIVAQYKQMEEKCADWDWEESRYQNLFTKSQRKAFVNGLNAIATVGEAVEEDEKVTVDQVEAAKKAEKAAKALKFNTKLLEKMYNQPAETLISTTKDFEATLKELGYKYQNTDAEQKVVAKDLEEAKKVLAKHDSAIDGAKWNTKNWQAIATVEKKVEEDARKLSDKLNKNFTSTYKKIR